MALRFPLREATLIFAATIPTSAQCQEAKLVAADAAPGDFGAISVGLSGNTAVYGAEFDDDNGANSGSLYVFERGPGGWVETAKLLPADNDFDDRFGFAVDVSGDTIIGATRYNQDLGYGTGSIHFFERSGGVWSEVLKLLPSDATNDTLFGAAVAIDGSRAVVGASVADIGGVLNAGAAYVFHEVGGIWVEVGKLVAPLPATGDRYGDRVSISGNTLVVSSFGDDETASAAGAVYVYEYDNLNWNFAAKLRASDGAVDDRFGIDVTVSGGEILVGSLRDGVAGTDNGAVYAFRKVAGVWTEVQSFEPSDSSSLQFFGASLTVDGSRALVGAWSDDTGAADQGAAYLFELQAGVWVEQHRLDPADSQAGKHFGFALDLEGDSAIVGARGDDTAGPVAGAMYSFSLSGTAGGDLSGCPGQISLSSGGVQSMDLAAGAAGAGDWYLVLGSASGTFPGTPTPAGVVPLNWDSWTAFTLGNVNTQLLPGSFGLLDGAGEGTATFAMPAASSPLLAGVVLHHAFVTLQVGSLQVDYLSQAVPLSFVP